LEAAKKLKLAGYNFRLKFVGDGPERRELESIAEKLGLAKYVEFTGFITGPAFQITMNEVAAVLMPSVWEETAGLAAIEQMMRGKLVIASDIGGLGEVVDGCGLRFPAGSSEALAQCMRRVLDHPEIVELNGKAALRRALDLFSQPRMVKEHFELYRQLTTSFDRSKTAERVVGAP
jgi:glycosyltransferase involved in cell wall biosynthesis